jgi:hypothetical protein
MIVDVTQDLWVAYGEICFENRLLKRSIDEQARKIKALERQVQDLSGEKQDVPAGE